MQCVARKAMMNGRCCINPIGVELRFLNPERSYATGTVYGRSSSMPFENSGTDMQLIDLPLKRTRHDPLAQSLDGVPLGFHQPEPMLTATHLPYASAQTSACDHRSIAVRKGSNFAYPGILSRKNHRSGTHSYHRLIHRLGVIGTITDKTEQDLVSRDLLQ